MFIFGDKDNGNEGEYGKMQYVKGEMFKSFVLNFEIIVIEDGYYFI